MQTTASPTETLDPTVDVRPAGIHAAEVPAADAPAADAPGAEDAVLAALISIGRLMKVAVPGSLEPGTMHLLHVVHDTSSLRVTDLAATLRLDVSTVSRHVQSLERSGLVARHPHPDDGRAQAVDLTDEGRHALRRAVEVRRSALRGLLAHWDRDRLERFAELLTAFTHDIEIRTTELEHP